MRSGKLKTIAPKARYGCPSCGMAFFYPEMRQQLGGAVIPRHFAEIDAIEACKGSGKAPTKPRGKGSDERDA